MGRTNAPKFNPTSGGVFSSSEATMSAPTHLISAQLASDLANTLSRLRLARTIGDERETTILSMRLDWLIDKIPRKVGP